MITRIEFKESYAVCKKKDKEFAAYVTAYTWRQFWVKYKLKQVDETMNLPWVYQHIIGEVLIQYEISQKMNNAISSTIDCICYEADACVSYAMNVPTSNGSIPISLGCTKQPTPVTKEKGNNPMYYDFRDNLKPEQIHLLKRASSVDDKLQSAAYEKFLQKPAAPKTAQELVDFIKAGDIRVLDKKDEDYNRFGGLTSNIIWSASWKSDQAGYDAAMAKIKTDYTAAKDLIIVSEPADGLKALQSFEATLTA